MEAICTLGSVMRSIKMLVDLISKNRELAGGVAAGLKSMNKDFELIRTVRLQRKQKQLQLTPGMELLLQELAYDIDDFIQGLWVPGPCGSFLLSGIGADYRPEIIQRIGDFKESIKNLKDELPKSFEVIPVGLLSSSPAGSPIPYSPEVDFVGLEGPKKDIVELLSPQAKPHLGRLCVISILGCRGSGKTALARALYQDQDVIKKFDYKAWVVASDHNSANILNKIEIQPVNQASTPGSSSEALEHFSEDKRYLVFVDDMKQWAPWKDMRNALCENAMDSRIIVTTSFPSVARECSSGSYVYPVQPLDQHNSRILFRAKYREEAGYSAEDVDGLGDNDVDIIINKCDGLPMALIAAAKCLNAKKALPLASINFNQVTQDLRDCLTCSESDFEDFKKHSANGNVFVEMRRVLVEPYEKLLNQGQKFCLLYVSMFPSGHQINSKGLIRRLIAEGLHPKDPHIMKDPRSTVEDVFECLWKLMDQSMIEPLPIRNYSNVAKWCRVHSIMLEFTIKNAVSRNFVSLIQKDQPLHNTIGKVRRLTVQSSPEVQCNGVPKKMGLSALRSLAIFKSGILDFEQCKLVRVLDLEGCDNRLTPEDLGKICGLLFLKYLSLRNTDIRNLPENVNKLKYLETLDTRGTAVDKLPVEVIMLPRLAYLFGKFELTNVHRKNRKKLTKFFSEKRSQLHTLGGICVDKKKGLEIVVLVVSHAIHLKKVKVWFKDTPSTSSTGMPALKHPAAGNRGLIRHKFKSLQIFNGRKSAGSSSDTTISTIDPAPATSTPPELTLSARIMADTLKEHAIRLDSISIDFNGVNNGFLDILRTPSPISSIKLRQGQGNLPDPNELQQLRNLKKLHLFSTGLECDKLGTLQHLGGLQYLKLAEEGHGLWESIFHVKVGGFISLIWLCFESSNSKHPPLKIDQGVKTPLASLLLLCEERKGPQRDAEEGLGVEGTSHLAKLNEVILHHSAPDAVLEAWKEETKKHINRPYVEKKPDKKQV